MFLAPGKDELVRVGQADVDLSRGKEGEHIILEAEIELEVDPFLLVEALGDADVQGGELDMRYVPDGEPDLLQGLAFRRGPGQDDGAHHQCQHQSTYSRAHSLLLFPYLSLHAASRYTSVAAA